MSPEVWKLLPGYETRYEISNLGRIRISGPDANGNSHYIGKILKPSKVGSQNSRYYGVTLGQNGRETAARVHRLVMLAFVGPPAAGMLVNHKNGRKLDNRLINLEYVTQRENTSHAYQVLGVQAVKGSAHGRSKLSDQQILTIRTRYAAGEFAHHLAKEFGVSANHTLKILRGEQWRHLKVVPSADRRQKGAGHGMAILTEADVKSIRQHFAAKLATQVQLAAEYGVTQTNISNIVLRKTWKHVP